MPFPASRPRPHTPLRPAPVREAAEQSAGGAPLGDLPEWNLDDLYPGPESEALRRDLDAARAEAQTLAADYEGRLASLTGDQLAEAVSRYESLQKTLGRVMSYAGLRHAQNTADPERAKFLGDRHSEVTDITAPAVFFTLELNRIEEADLAAKMHESPALARYRPWFDALRAFRPYQLSDELEKFLHDMSVVGASAWNRLFDETMARLTFEVEGQPGALPLESTLTLLSDPDRDTRAAAGRALAQVFADNLPLFTRIMNTLVKEHEVETRWRAMPSPQTGRHLANQVEPEVVQALRDAVVEAYPRLSHRYYAMKARWMGLEKLEYWDRNAPLPEVEDRKVPWDEAKHMVLET
ncbi:MAG: M3 family oligoendopeptidase, partial [Pseudomonadota bacterium]